MYPLEMRRLTGSPLTGENVPGPERRGLRDEPKKGPNQVTLRHSSVSRRNKKSSVFSVGSTRVLVSGRTEVRRCPSVYLVFCRWGLPFKEGFLSK